MKIEAESILALGVPRVEAPALSYGVSVSRTAAASRPVPYHCASVHGRFQPFHSGHLTYLLLAKERCQHLVIGITNPDSRHLRPHVEDPTRHLPENNPFTYFERLEMIRNSVLEAGLSLGTFTIVPFPIDIPELLSDYCPKVPVFMRDRGDWTRKKAASLEEHGWYSEILTEDKDLSISATDVRNRILEGDSWHALVPRGTQTVLHRIDARNRILVARTTGLRRSKPAASEGHI